MKNLVLTFCLLGILSIDSQAQNWWKRGITGEGPIVTRQLDLNAFDAIRLTNSSDVYIRQGSQQAVEVEGQENIIDNLVTDVDGEVWKIRFDEPVRRHQGLKIYITLPSLSGVRLSGSGNVVGENQFTGIEKFGVSVSGSGNIKLGVQARSVDAHISGSGNIRLAGSTGSMEIRISGSGDLSADELEAESCKVRISGSGDCDLDVRENLEVSISGSGDVNYEGRPRVSSKISGSGDIRGKS